MEPATPQDFFKRPDYACIGALLATAAPATLAADVVLPVDHRQTCLDSLPATGRALQARTKAEIKRQKF